MKVRITAPIAGLEIGTVLDVGEAPPKAWDGKYTIVEEAPEVVVETKDADAPVKAWRKPKPG